MYRTSAGREVGRVKKTSFVAFSKSQSRAIAESLGFKVRTGKLYYVKSKTRTNCATCLKPLTVKNVGNFAKGKKGTTEVYCDNPVCFASWIAENKIDMEAPEGLMLVWQE